MNDIRFNKNLILNNNRMVQATDRKQLPKKSFHEILDNINKKNELKFSKHAMDRLDNRNIMLTKLELEKINDAIEKAHKKGIKEALILMDNKAFIASVKNSTIITATTEENLKESIFTNIDGAVII